MSESRMSESEFSMWRDLRADVIRLRETLESMAASVAGCQAASRVRQDLARSRPSWVNAAAAWAALALTAVLALTR